MGAGIKGVDGRMWDKTDGIVACLEMTEHFPNAM